MQLTSNIVHMHGHKPSQTRGLYKIFMEEPLIATKVPKIPR